MIFNNILYLNECIFRTFPFWKPTATPFNQNQFVIKKKKEKKCICGQRRYQIIFQNISKTEGQNWSYYDILAVLIFVFVRCSKESRSSYV